MLPPDPDSRVLLRVFREPSAKLASESSRCVGPSKVVHALGLQTAFLESRFGFSALGARAALRLSAEVEISGIKLYLARILLFLEHHHDRQGQQLMRGEAHHKAALLTSPCLPFFLCAVVQAVSNLL